MKIPELIQHLIEASITNTTVTAESANEADMWKSTFHFVSRPYKNWFVLVYKTELREAKPSAPEYHLNAIAEDYKDGYQYFGFIYTKTGIWYGDELWALKELDSDYDGTRTVDIRTLKKEFAAAYKDCLVEKFLRKNPAADNGMDTDSIRYQLYKYILQGIDIPSLTLRKEVEAWKYSPTPDVFQYLHSPDSYVEEVAGAMLKKEEKELLHEYSKVMKIKGEYKKLQKNRSHPIWFKAEILHALPNDAKKVQVTIQLDHCTVTDTLKAEVIQDTTSLLLTGSDLPPKVIAILRALNSSEKGLKYSTIIQIRYRGKVVYDKAEFMKRVNAAAERGQ